MNTCVVQRCQLGNETLNQLLPILNFNEYCVQCLRYKSENNMLNQRKSYYTHTWKAGLLGRNEQLPSGICIYGDYRCTGYILRLSATCQSPTGPVVSYRGNTQDASAISYPSCPRCTKLNTWSVASCYRTHRTFCYLLSNPWEQLR